MAAKIISINRAPVLTLWASVVAERLGFNKNEALSLGKALAGLNAQSKGRRLGIFKPRMGIEPPTNSMQNNAISTQAGAESGALTIQPGPNDPIWFAPPDISP